MSSVRGAGVSSRTTSSAIAAAADEKRICSRRPDALAAAASSASMITGLLECGDDFLGRLEAVRKDQVRRQQLLILGYVLTRAKIHPFEFLQRLLRAFERDPAGRRGAAGVHDRQRLAQCGCRRGDLRDPERFRLSLGNVSLLCASQIEGLTDGCRDTSVDRTHGSRGAHRAPFDVPEKKCRGKDADGGEKQETYSNRPASQKGVIQRESYYNRSTPWFTRSSIRFRVRERIQMRRDSASRWWKRPRRRVASTPEFFSPSAEVMRRSLRVPLSTPAVSR